MISLMIKLISKKLDVQGFKNLHIYLTALPGLLSGCIIQMSLSQWGDLLVFTTEYLIHWLSYGPEFNSWVNIKDLGNARNLMNKFEQEDRLIKRKYCHNMRVKQHFSVSIYLFYLPLLHLHRLSTHTSCCEHSYQYRIWWWNTVLFCFLTDCYEPSGHAQTCSVNMPAYLPTLLAHLPSLANLAVLM